MTMPAGVPRLPQLFLVAVIGVILGESLPGYGILTLAFISICSCVLVFRLFTLRSLSVCIYPIFICLGYLAIQPWIDPSFPDHHIVYFADEKKHDITGIVHRPPIYMKNRTRFVLRVNTLNAEDKPATGDLRVTVYGDAPDLFIGDRVRISGRVKRPRNFGNPGGFDYERYLAFKDIHATSSISGKRLTVLNRAVVKGPAWHLALWRKRISAAIESVSTGPCRAVMKALTIGDKTEIPPEWRERFSRTGVGHLLAISGLHIGIIGSLFFFILKWLVFRFEYLAHQTWIMPVVAVLTLLPVSAYGYMSGMSPSTQRATIIAAVVILAFITGNIKDLVNTLSLAGLVIIAISPPSVFAISFQLSFVAVFFIIFGLPVIYSRTTMIRELPGKPVTTYILNLIFTSMLAIAGTLPLVMHYFNQVSLVGIGANIVFVPLIGMGVVPIALVSIFILPISQELCILGLKTSAITLEFALYLLDQLASLPYIAIETFTPTWVEIALYYTCFWAVLNLPGEENRKDFFVCTRKTALAVIAGTALIGIIDIGYWVHRRILDDRLRITVVDVGQGASSIIEFPKGDTMVLDGGGFYSNDIFDVGKGIIAPLLRHKKIQRIDTLMLSHPNADHLNGLVYIAGHFHPDKAVTNNQSADLDTWDEFIRILEINAVDHPDFRTLPRHWDVNGVRVDILYPSVDFLQKAVTDEWRDENANSMVVKFTYGDVSFLFPGDITARSEAELVDLAGEKLNSTVLVAPHHGSKTSSSAVFLDHVAPEAVVISCGWKNRYRFPHKSVLKRYRDRGCKIYRTDLHGAVAFITDGRNLFIRPFREP